MMLALPVRPSVAGGPNPWRPKKREDWRCCPRAILRELGTPVTRPSGGCRRFRLKNVAAERGTTEGCAAKSTPVCRSQFCYGWSRMWLADKESFTVNEMLYALMIQSASPPHALRAGTHEHQSLWLSRRG